MSQDSEALYSPKVLYYIDHVHYLETGKKLSGFKYIKQKAGPTPAPNQFLQARDELVEENKLEIKVVRHPLGKDQKRPETKNGVDPDVSSFSPFSLTLINNVINVFRPFNAQKSSALAYQELSVRMATLNEELPPYAYLLSEADVNQDDLAWAKSAIQEYKTAIRKR